MDAFEDFTIRAKRYLAEGKTSPVYPSPLSINDLEQLRTPLQEEPMGSLEVLSMLDKIGSPATVQSTGGRYFGFVTGGSLPAAMFAKLLATIWDQNAGLFVQSPVASVLEEITSEWLLSLFELPKETAVGFVTGATMANFTALASARHALLIKEGWDVEAKGLFHAPEITVITGDEVHASLLKALNLVGFGRERIIRIPTDNQGRMIAEKIPNIEGPLLICALAGNVNTGAFDSVREICIKITSTNKWVHVDAAFGLWAAASPKKKPLTEGLAMADSWATDAHKWLNVPYDCGLVFVKDKQALLAAMSSSASYLPTTPMREPFLLVPEMSREARGVSVWAALKSLGRKGVGELIERNCDYAQVFAKRLQEEGFSILNEVSLNQVLVSFGNSETTSRIIRGIQEEGTCWCGGTIWHGRTAMRISVSSWATTQEDVDQSIQAILKIAKRES